MIGYQMQMAYACQLHCFSCAVIFLLHTAEKRQNEAGLHHFASCLQDAKTSQHT
jgi:hypothetical protein